MDVHFWSMRASVTRFALAFMTGDRCRAGISGKGRCVGCGSGRRSCVRAFELGAVGANAIDLEFVH